MNRRDLIHRVIYGGAVLVLAPEVLQSCTKDSSTNPGGSVLNGNKVELDLTQAANAVLNTPGGSVIVRNILVINTGGGNFSAISSICTHQGCTVGYNAGAGNVQCPCHGSVYTTSGTVISGPAPMSLTAYAISLAGNVLSITIG